MKKKQSPLGVRFNRYSQPVCTLCSDIHTSKELAAQCFTKHIEEAQQYVGQIRINSKMVLKVTKVDILHSIGARNLNFACERIRYFILEQVHITLTNLLRLEPIDPIQEATYANRALNQPKFRPGNIVLFTINGGIYTVREVAETHGPNGFPLYKLEQATGKILPHWIVENGLKLSS